MGMVFFQDDGIVFELFFGQKEADKFEVSFFLFEDTIFPEFFFLRQVPQNNLPTVLPNLAINYLITAASSGIPSARYFFTFAMLITGLFNTSTNPYSFLAIMFGKPLVVNSLGHSYLAGCICCRSWGIFSSGFGSSVLGISGDGYCWD